MTTTHAVDVGGASLHIVERGTGAPVVFGHGLLFDHHMYDGQVETLAPDHRVVLLDWRAHGGSDAPAARWTMEDQGLDYVRVMDALGIDQAVVIGQSMGGMAALHVALRHPERVRGLVLIDTSAAAEPVLRRIKYMTLAFLARTVGMHPALLEQAAAVAFGPTFRETQPATVRSWMDRWAGMDPKIVARAVRVPVSRPSVVGRLSEITAPTLVIVGAEDETTPPSESLRLAHRLPHARLEILPRTGHMAPIERPEEVARLIRRFLTELGW